MHGMFVQIVEQYKYRKDRTMKQKRKRKPAHKCYENHNTWQLIYFYGSMLELLFLRAIKANFCNVFRRWYEAEDNPDISFAECFSHLMEGVDFNMFPPHSPCNSNINNSNNIIVYCHIYFMVKHV